MPTCALISMFIPLTNICFCTSIVPYTEAVPENLSPGSSIVTVVANDADSGLNQEITYSMVQATVTDPSSAMNVRTTVVCEVL